MEGRYNLILMAFVLLNLLVVVFVVGLVFHRLRVRRRNLERLAGGGLHLEPREPQRVSLDVGEYFRLFFPQAGKVPPALVLYVPVAAAMRLAIKREGVLERFFKRIGVSVEPQVGEQRFDADYYIISDHAREAQEGLFDSRAREAVAALFGLGFTALILDRGHLQAVVVPLTPGKEGLSAEVLDQAGAHLLTLACRLSGRSTVAAVSTVAVPPPYPSSLFIGRAGWTVRRVSAYVTASAAVVVGFSMALTGHLLYRPLDGVSLFVHALWIGALLWLVYLLLLARWISGRPDSHYDFMINGAVGMVGLPLLCAGGLLVGNGLLDSSAATPHTAQVIGKRSWHDKNGEHYEMRLASWRPGVREEELSIGGGLFHRLIPGEDRVTVITRQGHFGYEWVVTIEAPGAR